MTTANWDAGTWDMIQSGPADAEHTVLLLPGGWCTAISIEELMAEPAWPGSGWSRSPCPATAAPQHPQDLSMENYARLTAELADSSAARPWWDTAGGPTSPWRWWVPVRSPDLLCCWHPRSLAGTRR